MAVCPYCQHDNIDGTDLCEACHQSLTDLPAAGADKSVIERDIETRPIAVLSPQEPICVTPFTPVGEVVELLAARNIGCVLVLWEDRLTGIFSERDALMKIGTRLEEVADEPIRNYMTSQPQTLTLTDTIATALNRMAVGDYRHIPVTGPDGLRGIISVRDILGYLTRYFQDVLNAPI